MVPVVISDLLICLFSAFRRRPPTAWSLSLWGWTASCRGACRPLWPSTLWPTRCSDDHFLQMMETYRAAGLVNKLGRPKSENKQFYICMYLFIHLISGNRRCQKQNVFLWSESKRKLGNTVSVETRLSFSCLLFSPFIFCLWPRKYHNAATLWSQKSVWCLTNSLFQSTGTQPET